ncbi:putative toxin-antitoxin system toxin component, PIN family [Uliginosibacterium sp. TH139]|uniref:putative toxin-antitoxin system toxin component, PIN family n=1 Tax=Uliginosibacterium sp. TH139 TaxID=2067453 RepID=UPI000C7D2210|nr:putative toxin-antitoxin system toxin component, PIN family [Uliginosibacterium sp. TH139]PLK50857.1 putative toxin-antitoxin system toxin component, PIN family [Uliginosibacterium sp. TH139]
MPFSLPSSHRLRVVIDTNVVMALWHFRDPALATLADWVGTSAVELLTRADCLDELARVLAYVQFRIEPAQRAQIYATYAQAARCLPEPDDTRLAELDALPRCKDRDDQKFLTLAWLGEADLLLTRDKLLLKLARKSPFRERLRILTPELWQRELLAAEALALSGGES